MIAAVLDTSLTRRRLAVGAAALLAARLPPAQAAADALAAIEHAHGGRLGVFALDTGTGAVLAHRADERFLLASTFKGSLAATVLSRVDAGRDGLDEPVSYNSHDLLPVSPVTQAHLAAGRLTVGTLCQAILVWGDNAAANLLLARVGGPAALTGFIRGLGDVVTRCDRFEPVDGWSGIADTTTPRAITGLARAQLLGDVLRPSSRALLERWMAMAVVGRARLRAVLPTDWTGCDRTGTGDGICNDYALARRPHAAPLLMVVYHDAPGLTVAAQEATLREAGAAIVRWAGAKPRQPDDPTGRAQPDRGPA